MTKGFMEVFPELVLEQEVRALFEKVKVERVTTTRQKDLIRVYISCGRLIPKTVIFRVEEEIARQLFPNCNITIKIQEKFQLSAQYNLKSLLETYQESILLELKECSPVEYSLFKSANISFPDEGKLVLEVPDTVIAHERCPELVRILEKICCERCGIPMEAVAHYCQPKENPRKAEEEIALARKVAMIAAKAGARPAATDYGMSQEQFASVMSGGYSASGNDGQPQYAGGQDGTACNAAQNADSSSAQYGAAGIAGQNGAMPGDRAESSMQAGGMDAGYEAYLASMGAAAQTQISRLKNYIFQSSSVRSDPDRCQATSAEHPGSSHPSISTDGHRWILPASSHSQALSYIPMLSYFPRTGNPPYRTSCKVWESVFRRS